MCILLLSLRVFMCFTYSLCIFLNIIFQFFIYKDEKRWNFYIFSLFSVIFTTILHSFLTQIICALAVLRSF